MEKTLLKNTIELAIAQLENHGLAEVTLLMYRSRCFKPVVVFFESKDCIYYDDVLMKELESVYSSQLSKDLISKNTYNMRIRGVRILEEISKCGHFEWKVYTNNEREVISSYFEDILHEFIETLNHLSQKRKSIYESITRRYFSFLLKRNIDNLSKINGKDLNDFVVLISKSRPDSMDDVMTNFRKLFAFCETHKGITSFKHFLLAAPKSRKHKVFPCFAADEITRLLNSIETTTPTGKRDYAILLLASTTGLRAGDLAKLKLTDIDWKNSEITFIQGKTKKALRLPLTKIAGDSLADYILNARPQTKLQFIFLRSIAPFNQFKNGDSIADIFERYLKKIGIIHEVGDGKTFHGIRRLLATEMLYKQTPVTTIAQVLGHKDMNVTKRYISLDIPGLTKCTLGFDSLTTGRDTCESV